MLFFPRDHTGVDADSYGVALPPDNNAHHLSSRAVQRFLPQKVYRIEPPVCSRFV